MPQRGGSVVSFLYQLERSEETDDSVIASAVIRPTGRGLLIRIWRVFQSG